MVVQEEELGKNMDSPSSRSYRGVKTKRIWGLPDIMEGMARTSCPGYYYAGI